MNEAATLTVTNESLSIFNLIIHASLLVQIVLLILVAASEVTVRAVHRDRGSMRGD